VNPRRLISFSVFGTKPMYLRGAVKNALLAPEVYPGWTCRFYVERGLAVADELRSLGAEVVEREAEPGLAGTFWRFEAASDPMATHIVFRDTDSRLNVREKAAVDEWIASGADGHVLRDHPEHVGFKLPAGMWGVRGGVLFGIENDMRFWSQRDAHGDDQYYLQDRVWPRVSSWLEHGTCGAPFPPHAPYNGFVGQPVGPEE